MENNKRIEKFKEIKELENDLETQEPKIINTNAEPFDFDQEIDNVNRELEVIQDKLDDIANIVLEKLEKEEKSDNLNQSKEIEELNNNVKIMGIEIGGFFVSWIISMAIIFFVMSKYPNISTCFMTLYVILGTICVNKSIRAIVNEITKKIKGKNSNDEENEEKEQMDRMEVLEKIAFETKIEECLESVSLLKAILSEEERKKVFIDCNNQKININSFYKSEQLMKKYVNQIINVKKEEQGIILLKLKEK